MGGWEVGEGWGSSRLGGASCREDMLLLMCPQLYANYFTSSSEQPQRLGTGIACFTEEGLWPQGGGAKGSSHRPRKGLAGINLPSWIREGSGPVRKRSWSPGLAECQGPMEWPGRSLSPPGI